MSIESQGKVRRGSRVFSSYNTSETYLQGILGQELSNQGKTKSTTENPVREILLVSLPSAYCLGKIRLLKSFVQAALLSGILCGNNLFKTT